MISPVRATATLALGISLAFVGLEALASLTGASSGLHFALAALAVELGTILALAIVPRRASVVAEGAPRRVSVLVAAWNERTAIARTVASLFAQEGVELEVIVADDGSTDGTAAVVPARARLVRIAHAGKGAALEAARAIARHPIVVTVDADTELEPDALRTIAAAFDDEAVVAAGGATLVRPGASALETFQRVEYRKTTWARAGWAALGLLEQIPGAFSAFRASALDRAGGFPLDSLTEDYEVSYRLRRALGPAARIVLVPEARAWTEPPRTLPAFVRQRTRWFAGFLSTLWRFRAMILDPRHGVFGLVRLPVKVLDAALPLALLVTVALFVHGAVLGEPLVSALGASLVGLRVAVELGTFVAADRLDTRRARSPDERRAQLWLAAILDGASYAFLRSVVVLRAYPFAVLRARTWERSRTDPSPDVAPETALDAPAE